MVDIAVLGSPRARTNNVTGDGSEEWRGMLAATLSAAGRETGTSANALLRLQDAFLTAADVLRRSEARDPAGRTLAAGGLDAVGFSQDSFAPRTPPSGLSASRGPATSGAYIQSSRTALDDGARSGPLGTDEISRELRASTASPVSDLANATAYREIRLEGEATFAALARASDGASRRIVRGFAAAFDAGRSFQDMVRELALDVSEVGLRNFVLRPLEQGLSQGLQFLSGPIANALGGVSARAAGGPVSAGDPFLVGERGPELFVPHHDGAIVPSAGAVTQQITVNVEGGINNAGRKTPGQVAALIAREAARQGRRNN